MPRSLEGGEEGRGHGREGLALAGGELGDPAPGHGEAGEHLFVEGTLTQSALGGLADEGEGLGRHRLEAGAAGDLFPQHPGPGHESLVRTRSQRLLPFGDGSQGAV